MSGEQLTGKEVMASREMGSGLLVEAGRVREACAGAYDAILQALPVPSRERSLALTKLEEASMWAVKAISRT